MADDRVVGLDGKPVGSGPAVDADLVEVLESMLRDAAAGKITSFAMATLWNGQGVASAYHVGRGDSCVTLLGAVTRLAHNVSRDMDKKETAL